MSDGFLASYPGSSGLLARRCRECFDDRVCNKAGGYFTAGWVSQPVISGHRISAKVSGPMGAEVELLWNLGDPDLVVICTCSTYRRGTFCEHIWAVILKVDQVGLGLSVPGKGELFVLHKSELLDEEEFAKVQDELERPTPKPTDRPWLSQIRAIQQRGINIRAGRSDRFSLRGGKPRIAYFGVDLALSKDTAHVMVQFFYRERLAKGGQGKMKHERISKEDLSLYDSTKDRDILGKLLLYGKSPQGRSYSSGGYSSPTETTYGLAEIPPDSKAELVRELCETGRFGLLQDGGGNREILPLTFDDQIPWRLELDVSAEPEHYKIGGHLVRRIGSEEERLSLELPKLLLSSGLVIFSDRIARLDAEEHFGWISSIRSSSVLRVPLSDGLELMEVLQQDSKAPSIRWPKELEWPKETLTPSSPLAVINTLENQFSPELRLGLRFTYENHEVHFGSGGTTILDKDQKRIIVRDQAAETGFIEKIKTLKGVELALGGKSEYPFKLDPEQFSQTVGTLLQWGFRVEAHGKKVRPSGEFDIQVSSGIDWFDVNGGAKFEGGLTLTLPKLLLALERKENLIPLGDGSVGMLPSDWLEKYAPLAKLGKETEDGLRFTRGQGALIAAWFEEESVTCDPDFSKLMEAVKSRTSLKARSPLPTFKGKLRPYQKDGLAWLGFLREIGLGGILADDMGLGKTVQVLAHLQAEYASIPIASHLPTLIAVPKSLLFNWRDEAERFTPNLKVLSYCGGDRHHLLREVKSSHIVLVTYSTLRLDIEELRKQEFHYVISDEAQAIKNADSQSHLACRLLRGKYRLAMTGTPVENSVDDLIAILDFVSPGLLGDGVRHRLASATAFGKIDAKTLSQLSKALRPFILRRTKDQVLKDLPDKTEKVLHCELSSQEMRQYHELREHYRAHLAGEVKRRGLSRSKIVILEALLRLRQAACHPGLLDKKRINAPSAKVEALISQIHTVTSKGHKALVFSQFTSFLDIVGYALKKEGIAFERLDGQTPHLKRRDMVHRFQTESKPGVFLISMKAGGVGLNLTAADYVFILDPWWNPAVESQAIDRSHRIGQRNKVIAYKLITKNTVEEKIIELQKQKREVADAIISADASLLKKLTPEDIEVLFS